MRAEPWHSNVGAAWAIAAAAFVLLPASAAGQSVGFAVRGHAPAMASIEVPVKTVELPADLGTPYSGTLFSFIERSNARHGHVLTLDVKSAQTLGAPALTSGEGASAIPYQLYYGGQEVRFDGGQALLNDARAPLNGVREHVLSIKTPAASRPAEGTYQDTIRLTVSAR
jgi:hypothetical protein